MESSLDFGGGGGPNLAHTRQSRPYSGLGFLVNFLGTFLVVPSSLGSG